MAKETETREIPTVTVGVELNADGRIIAWDYSDEGYKLPQNELNEFSECSGNCYKIDGDTLVFDESLDVIETYQLPQMSIEQIQAKLDYMAIMTGVEL